VDNNVGSDWMYFTLCRSDNNNIVAGCPGKHIIIDSITNDESHCRSVAVSLLLVKVI